MNTDIQAHEGHRLMIWPHGAVYCKQCDLFLQWKKPLIINIVDGGSRLTTDETHIPERSETDGFR